MAMGPGPLELFSFVVLAEFFFSVVLILHVIFQELFVLNRWRFH